MTQIISHNSLPIQHLNIPKELCILVLAPHPDDFDAIGVTMRFFQENKNPLYLAVAASGARGVEDTFCSPPTLAVKTKIRQKEQKESCRFFGLPDTHLTFLRLEEDETGNLLENRANIHRLRRYLLKKRPEMVFLPHGQDANITHQRVYSMYRQVAGAADYPIATFFNRDPKTVKMRCDFFLGYEEVTAVWKGELLRIHRSQHHRNLNRRGYGMDTRILSVDRHSAEVCSTGTSYAEIFELKLYGTQRLETIIKGKNHMDLFSEIKNMIVDVFALDEDVVVADAHLQDDLGGDSLAIINLSEAIAKKYSIDIQGEDLIELDNVGQLIALVKSKISSKP
jgi:acyl carrier protein